jgi:phosphohistidine swiveling domain-containing protein
MDSIIVLADVLGDVVGNSVDALLNEYGIDDASAYGLFLETHSESPLPTNISLARAALGEIASTVHSRQYLFDKFQKNSPKTIAEYLRTNDPDVLKLLNDYIERFGWMSIYSFTGAPYSLDEVIRHVQDQIDQPDAVNTYGPQVASQEPEIEVLRNSIRNITINPKIRNLLEATRKLTYVNTAKDDAHQLTWLKIAPLMQAISARLALTLEEITYLTANEISEALEHGDLDLSAIKERMESWVLIKTPSAILALQGSHQVSEFKRRLRGLERLDSSHLSGLPVFPGRVKGRARVVLNSTDCEKVKTGDILVASNTNPDFIPAMRRAAAFVTDTGNLICHAVIAAREFRKPCVISTQIATRVIRDGEWLEVDGSNGTITRVGTE